MLNIIINDGYTEPFYIAAVPGIHGAVRGKFRPMLTQDRAVIFGDKVAGLAPRDRERRYAEAIAARVTEWDIATDAAGTIAPVTVANVLLLKPLLENKLFDIVAGAKASDPDPDEKPTEAEARDHTDAEIEAAVKGVSFGHAKEELDRGN